jgi:ankyrin repeat protein
MEVTPVKEVRGKFFLTAALLSILMAGCATTTPTSGPGPAVAAMAQEETAERIFFPGYNLSLLKPPQEWEKVKEPGEGELVIWLNRDNGSVIEIMVSRAGRQRSYHTIAAEFNKITCTVLQQKLPTVTCVIVDERKVNYNENEFYRLKIIYQGMFQDEGVKSLVYLHRTDNLVYHFMFMDEQEAPIAKEMMQSIVFSGNRQTRADAEKKCMPLSFIDACYYGDRATVEGLLAAGVDINARNKEGVTALAYAADRGHLDIVKILLAHDADVNAKSRIGSTALINAAYMGHAGIVQELIAGGADVNAQSNDGTSALMNAAARGHKQVVLMLLAHGADVDAREKYGLAALWNAISSGHNDIVVLLINSGTDVNARANDGTTALMNAAFTGNLDVVKLLLKAGAHVNAKAKNGWTALALAKQRGYLEIVRVLIEAGAMEDSPRRPGI